MIIVSSAHCSSQIAVTVGRAAGINSQDIEVGMLSSPAPGFRSPSPLFFNIRISRTIEHIRTCKSCFLLLPSLYNSFKQLHHILWMLECQGLMTRTDFVLKCTTKTR